jgi:hypothetical protein
MRQENASYVSIAMLVHASHALDTNHPLVSSLRQTLERRAMWESVLKTLGIDALKAGLRKAGKQISKREYAELISEAVRELLKLHPDITAAEAKLLAAEVSPCQ